MIAVLIFAAIIASAVAGAFVDTGWRSAAKKELDLYKALKDVADNKEDRAALRLLKESAVLKIRKGATRKKKVGHGLAFIVAEFPMLVFYFAILLPLFAISLVGQEVTKERIADILISGGLCAITDIILRFLRLVSARISSKREDGDADK